MNFNLSQMPDRCQKPRTNGITMVMDKGLSINEVNTMKTNNQLDMILEKNMKLCHLLENIIPVGHPKNLMNHNSLI